MFNKKGLVGISSFILILVLLSSILIMIFTIYNEYNEKENTDMISNSIYNSLYSFRNSLINSILLYNTTIYYNNKYDLRNLFIYEKDNYLFGYYDKNDYFIYKNISLLGIPLCNKLDFSPILGVHLKYNGSCIYLSN